MTDTYLKPDWWQDNVKVVAMKGSTVQILAYAPDFETARALGQAVSGADLFRLDATMGNGSEKKEIWRRDRGRGPWVKQESGVILS